MAATTKEHPALLREMVASPGGTTIAGLAVLEQAAVRSAFISAVKAADRPLERAFRRVRLKIYAGKSQVFVASLGKLSRGSSGDSYRSLLRQSVFVAVVRLICALAHRFTGKLIPPMMEDSCLRWPAKPPRRATQPLRAAILKGPAAPISKLSTSRLTIFLGSSISGSSNTR